MRISDWSSDVCSSDLVGGGFGIKNYIYPEQILVAWATRRVGRPVKWYPDRSDGFVTDAQARDHGMRAGLALVGGGGSGERRVGKEWVRTCSCRVSPYN